MRIRGLDWFLYILPILLLSFGLVEIYSLTYGGEKSSLFYNQLIFGIVGLGLMVFFTFLDYRVTKSVAIFLYFLGIAMLGAVLIFGKKIFGATRWIDFGFFSFQPSEFFKLILIIFFARMVSNQTKEFGFPRFILFLVALFFPLLLVLRQPDFGTAITILIGGVSLLLVSKINRNYLIGLTVLLVILVPLFWALMASYQKERIITYFNPGRDPFGAGYNVLQSTIAVGSGGLFGRGIGYGPQSQLHFLPSVWTDFIFAGVAEAVGFLGSIVLILFFFTLLLRMIGVARLSEESYGSLLAVGIATIFLFQFFINIGMNLGLVPITGIPLPFVSYGGSALLTNFIEIGILQSIYLRQKKITF